MEYLPLKGFGNHGHKSTFRKVTLGIWPILDTIINKYSSTNVSNFLLHNQYLFVMCVRIRFVLWPACPCRIRGRAQ